MPQVTGSFSAFPVSVILDGSGNGAVAFQATGSNVRVTNVYVSVNTSALQAACYVSKGQQGPSYTIANTNSGSTGANASGSVGLVDGDTLYVTWTGGDPGSVATANFSGNKVPFPDARDTVTVLEFSDPFAAGDGAIIFPALKSPNFVTGVSGWIIRRDGTFELGGGTFRGTLDIRLANGRGIVIQPAFGEIELHTQNSLVGLTVIEGTIGTTLSDVLNSGTGSIQIITPNVGGGTGRIDFISKSADGTIDANLQVQANISITGGGRSLLINGVDLGRGIVAVGSISSNSPPIGTTETEVLLTDTAVPFEANRAYEATLLGGYTASVANNEPIFRLRRSNGAGTGQLGCLYRRTPAPVAAREYGLTESQIFRTGSPAPAAGFMAITVAGLGASTAILAATNGGAWVIIKDIGPATSYAFANQIT